MIRRKPPKQKPKSAAIGNDLAGLMSSLRAIESQPFAGPAQQKRAERLREQIGRLKQRQTDAKRIEGDKRSDQALRKMSTGKETSEQPWFGPEIRRRRRRKERPRGGSGGARFQVG